jgi:hypothetical protein
LRVGHLDGEFDEAAAHAEHLFLGGRPQIVRGNHRAQPARGGDGLQSGHARADDEDTRAGVMVPAAVVSMGNILGSLSAASNTAL